MLVCHGGSISNIHVSPYEDYAYGEQSLEWKYESQTVANSLDPGDWDQFDEDAVCNTGQAQSPINIDTDNIEEVEVGVITGVGFNTNITGYLANTGRMVQFTLLSFNRPTIKGGPFAADKM